MEAPEIDYKALYLETQKEVHRLAQLLEESIAGNKELQDKLDRLLRQLEKKNKKEHGSKNERHNPRPAVTSAKKNAETTPMPPQPQLDETDSEANPSLSALVADGTLPGEPIEHKVDPFLAICPECQVETAFWGTQVTHQLEKITGALKVLVHNQEVRSCNRCKQYVIKAEKTSTPLPGSYAAPDLLAFVIVSKFVDGLPLYRIRKILQRDGVPIPRSTLSDWILSSAFTLQPLYDTMKRELFKSKIVKTDDSPAKIQDRKIKGKLRRGKISTYVGDKNHPLTLFDFSPDESFGRNKEFLRDFIGLVQADAHKGFDALFTGETNKIELACHVHCRRNWFECPDCTEKHVEEVLDIYSRLYQIEDRIAKLPPAEKLAWRRRCSKPLIKRLHIIFTDIRNSKLPPKDPIRDAAEYGLDNWLALTRFLKDSDIDLDNNESERAIKDYVLMRKNSLFFGSDDAGHAAAIHLSLVASAKRAGIDPVSYLTDVLSCINDLKTSELEQLLPTRWAAARATTAANTTPDSPRATGDDQGATPDLNLKPPP